MWSKQEAQCPLFFFLSLSLFHIDRAFVAAKEQADRQVTHTNNIALVRACGDEGMAQLGTLWWTSEIAGTMMEGVPTIKINCRFCERQPAPPENNPAVSQKWISLPPFPARRPRSNCSAGHAQSHGPRCPVTCLVEIYIYIGGAFPMWCQASPFGMCDLGQFGILFPACLLLGVRPLSYCLGSRAADEFNKGPIAPANTQNSNHWRLPNLSVRHKNRRDTYVASRGELKDES